ncbi:DUF4270 family protein [Oscillatoria amoena NRMC-F 0135]|nr:DUF4270 family protein [Oscillatoria amoena NRMC-F 0135]
MNLWVKRTGQLLLAALFLMACEDETSLLGFQANNRFNVKYQDFLVGEGAVVAVDPELTDPGTSSSRLLVGEHDDPIIGTIRTEAFAEFLPSLTTKLAQKGDHTYVYDSLVLQLRLDGYTYGLSSSSTGTCKFSIRTITETDPLNVRQEYHVIPGTNKQVLVQIANRYYSNSIVNYADETRSLGETHFEKIYLFEGQERRIAANVTVASLEQQDTLVARSRLDDDFGLELFNIALNDDNGEFSDQTKFRSRFKGLALIPETCNAVYGLEPVNAYSQIRLYYHSELAGQVVDTLTRDFGFSGVSFHNITPDRVNELPVVDPPYAPGEATTSLRVIQGGYPMVTKIDLSRFYEEFADQVSEKNIIINAAELVIESVNTDGDYKPLPALELRLMQADNNFVDYRKLDQAVQDSLAKFFIFTNQISYYVSSDLSTQSQNRIAGSLLYNGSNKTYTGSLTLFVQTLFQNKTSQYRPLYLGLYPGTGITGVPSTVPTGKTLDRTVFMKENIKLRIYYTQPNNQNL